MHLLATPAECLSASDLALEPSDLAVPQPQAHVVAALRQVRSACADSEWQALLQEGDCGGNNPLHYACR